MASKMTAFDMEEEKEEGHFDRDANFCWDEDTTKHEDAWLQDVSDQQMDLAKQAKSHREFRDELVEETLTTDAANTTLLMLLNSHETVLQGLKRLGSKKIVRVRHLKKRKQTQRNENTTRMQTAEEKRQFEEITEAADFLMRSGDTEVYFRTKEEFVLQKDILAKQRQVIFSADSEEKFTEDEYHDYLKGDSAVQIRQVQVASAAAVIDATVQEMLDDFGNSKTEEEAQSVVDDDDDKQGRKLMETTMRSSFPFISLGKVPLYR
ncbi:hypothetical protein PsorP6_000002 [Peronosclerospora sorghi]|uniref:Uncharacterized protein n=1 Tax=Peronosclerospora sorghi TaxID=230839 RepID=A0ACC0WT32_9STRA|nr:hypothetical protein PsorP6_000002 [Peronosclerospora sorghi]